MKPSEPHFTVRVEDLTAFCLAALRKVDVNGVDFDFEPGLSARWMPGVLASAGWLRLCK
jgi:hypothetical protein